MPFTKPFVQLSKYDATQAGGKGASLGEMTRVGIPVPPGFVVLTNAFERFLKETSLNAEIESILDRVNHEEVSSIERASEQIRALILSRKMPKDIAKEVMAEFVKLKSPYVAVRSSATAEDGSAAAWAGQLDSFLNTNKTTLLDHVRKCWASLFTPRAIFYRFEKKMHSQSISVAVVIQKMVVSETSGIAFSVHPVTQDRNQMIIEAGFGLGEAIVSGQITPDSYVIEKQPRSILNKQIAIQERGMYRAKNGGNEWKSTPKSKGQQQVLSDKEILKLGEIILNIEKHYGFPVDVEWATEKGKFYVVQSRPITTLNNTLRSVSRKQAWSSENSKDYYKPFSDPANIEVMIRQLSVWPEQVTLDMTLLNWPGTPYKNLPYWVKYVSTGKKNKREVFLYWDRKIELQFLSLIEHRLQRDPSYFSWLERRFKLWYRQFDSLTKRYWRQGSEYFEQRSNNELRREFQQLIKTSALALVGYYIVYDLTSLLTRLVRQEMDHMIPDTPPAEVERIYREVAVTGISSIVRAEQLKFLKRLQEYQQARTQSARDRIVAQQWFDFSWVTYHHGTHRELTVDDYRRKFQRQLRFNAKKALATLEREQRQEHDQLVKLLNQFRSRPKALRHIHWLRTMMGYRNNETLLIHTYYAHAMPLLGAIADRLNIEDDDIWWLSKEEIMGGLRGKGDIPRVVRARKLRGFTIKQVGSRILVWTGVRVEDRHQREVEKSAVLHGQTAYPGKIRGRVRIIFDPAVEGQRVAAGDVLVTSMTTPEYVPLMKKASAVITNEGGLLCHAAIVARELKKPCVIGTKVASKVLKNGDQVEVDATNGIIKKL